MQVPILSGAYSSEAGDFRTSMPRNLVPVPSANGISKGYLRPADGITTFGAGPGIDFGGINWNDVCYRVMGTKLVQASSTGTITTLGDVGTTGTVTMDYSFDRLAIAAGGRLYYWNGTTLTQVTDPDLGVCIDFVWIDGYFASTDGTFICVTDLNDPYAVNPLKYGSSEVDPDKIVGLDKIRNELWAMNRFTVEVFDNIGGTGFPFQRVDGAMIPKGAVGTFAFTKFLEGMAFVGSGRNEAVSVYLGLSGQASKLSTREIDQIINSYTPAQQAMIVCEDRVFNNHQHLWIRLPDRTLIYDAAASAALEEPVWYIVDSGTGAGQYAQYRAQNLVYCYNKWIVGDPLAPRLGVLVDNISSQYGNVICWEFGTLAIYNEGNSAIIHEIELVALTGRVPIGADPVIWTSYSLNGETWSVEKSIKAGKIGQRGKRLCWRDQGDFTNWRIQRFRGTSECFASFARLEMQIEALSG